MIFRDSHSQLNWVHFVQRRLSHLISLYPAYPCILANISIPHLAQDHLHISVLLSTVFSRLCLLNPYRWYQDVSVPDVNSSSQHLSSNYQIDQTWSSHIKPLCNCNYYIYIYTYYSYHLVDDFLDFDSFVKLRHRTPRQLGSGALRLVDCSPGNSWRCPG